MILFNFNYCDTKLYKYSKSKSASTDLDNDRLAKIISENPYNAKQTATFIYECYDQMIKQNLIDIIYEIIQETYDNSTNEELMLALAVIDNDNFDIMNTLINRGFNLNQVIYENNSQILFDPSLHPTVMNKIYTDSYSLLDFDLLSYAICQNNFAMVKLMLDHGADPEFCNYSGLKNVCHIVSSNELFEYFLEKYSTQKSLGILFHASCSQQRLDNIIRLLSVGFNLQNINIKFSLIMGNLGVEIVEFLLNHGLIIDYQIVLLEACKSQNIKLIEFLLRSNMSPNFKVLETLILKCTCVHFENSS